MLESYGSFHEILVKDRLFILIYFDQMQRNHFLPLNYQNQLQLDDFLLGPPIHLHKTAFLGLITYMTHLGQILAANNKVQLRLYIFKLM